MANVPPDQQEDTYASLARSLHERVTLPVWKRTLLDMAVGAFMSATVSAVLVVSVSSLATMTGYMRNSRPVPALFALVATPFFLVVFAWFTRDSKAQRRAYEQELKTLTDLYPDFPVFYDTWKQKNQTRSR